MAPRLLARALSASYLDPVDEWKRQALWNAGVSAAAPRHQPRFGVRPRLGFVLVVMVAGAPLGVVGWATTLLTLLSVLFVQELPLAFWARFARPTACIVLSARGSHTEVSGPPFGARTVLSLALVGSLANLGVAALLTHLVRRGVAGPAAALLSAAAVAHTLWGCGQALPLTPFRVGQAFAGRLRPPLRFAYAAVSLVGVGVAGLWALRAPGLPAYFWIFVVATTASTSALRDAFNELNDQQSGVATLAAAANTRLHGDQPEQALDLAMRALANARVEGNRTPLWKTVAWAAIGKRDPFTAHGALLNLGENARDLHLVAAYLACCNRNDEAIELLRVARRRHRTRETSMLLIDLLFQAGQQTEALSVADIDRELFTAAEHNAIESSMAGSTAPSDRAGQASISSRQS